jgi:hypothetical protein
MVLVKQVARERENRNFFEKWRRGARIFARQRERSFALHAFREAVLLLRDLASEYNQRCSRFRFAHTTNAIDRVRMNQHLANMGYLSQHLQPFRGPYS